MSRDRPSLPDFLQSISEEAARPPAVAPDIDAERLRDSFRSYHTTHTFRPGDIVRRKSGCDYARDADPPTGLFVVLEIDEAAKPVKDPARMEIYGIKFDLQIGWFDPEGDFCYMSADSRRLEPTEYRSAYDG